MSARGLFSVVLKNVNRQFGNSASCYRIFQHGESSVLFADSNGFQNFHLSSIINAAIPDPPKRPKPAYAWYVMSRKEEFHKNKPGIKFQDIVKVLANDWNLMSQEEKKPYVEKHILDQAEFKVLKDKWWQNLSIEQKEEYKFSQKETKILKQKRQLKKTLRLLGKPKRPCNSFSVFVSQIKPDSIKTGQKIFAYASDTWKLMSDDDKRPFVEVASTAQKMYKEKLLEWEDKMLKGGNEDYVYSNYKNKKTSKRS